MKPRYSVFSLARNAMNYHKDWERAWRSPAPKKEYDAVIVGAGGHGLATAYYLAKNHKMTNIAVVEKGWLGGGNTGRNTTIIRSNYLQDPSVAIYEPARSLYEDLSQDLNYNVMFCPRGVLMLCADASRVPRLSADGPCQQAAGGGDGVHHAAAGEGVVPDPEHRRAALSGAGRAVAGAGWHGAA